MAQVEVSLGGAGDSWRAQSVVVSYDPRLLREAARALEEHDDAFHERQRAVEDGDSPPPLSAPRSLTPDPDRAKWQVGAYTLSNPDAAGYRLVLLDADEEWVLVAVDEQQLDDYYELNTAPYGEAAPMVEEFLTKAEADRARQRR